MVNYVVVLNSLNKIGTAINDTKYYYDWTTLPNGKYKLTFSYIGSLSNINGYNVPSVHCDLGQAKTFTSSSTRIQSINTKNIGFLTFTGLGLIAPSNLNTPIYLPIPQDFFTRGKQN